MAIDYYVEYATVPTATLALAVLSPPTSNAAISAWIAGYLLWVVAEYWMHRYLFHRVYRKQHMIHHFRPHDPTGAPNTWAVQLAQGALVALALALFQQYIGAALAGGWLAGYLTYIVTHHAIHAEWLSPSSRVRLRHELHHKGIEKNFSLLNPLGDLLFGTYQEPAPPAQR